MTTLSRLTAVALLAAVAAWASAPLAQYEPLPPAVQPFHPRWEIGAIAGYQVNTDVATTSGHLAVDDTPVYGLSLSLQQLPGVRGEIIWLYSNPTVHASGSTLLNGSQPIHVPTHYFQIGGTRGIRRGNLEPYLGATIGAALFMPSRLEYSNGTSTALHDTWRFAFTIDAGLYIHLGEKVAIRGEARVAAPVYFSSTTFYVGGTGAGLGVSGGIPIWQWDFTGALVFTP